MATIQEQIDKAPDKLNDCVCSVCMDTYKCPKILPCLHTFCKECLLKIVEQCEVNSVASSLCTDCRVSEDKPSDLGKDDKSWILDSVPVDLGLGTAGITCPCPVCKREHVLSDGGVEDLPDDAQILENQEQMSIRQTGSMKRFRCTLCCSTEDEVVEYCSKCPGFLCAICIPAHKRQSRYSDHQTVASDEVRPEHYVSSLRSRVITCRDHSKDVVYRCNDCCLMLCLKCVTSGKHKLHDFETIEDSDQALTTSAQKMTNSSTQVLAKFRHQKDYILRVEEEVLNSTHNDKLKGEINHHFDQCVQYLEDTRKVFLDKVDEDFVSLKKQVWAQKEFLEQTITAVESGIRFAEKARSVHNPIERINLNSQVISHLKQFSDKTWTPTPINPPLVFKHPGSPESHFSIPDLSPLQKCDISLDIDTDVSEQLQLGDTAQLIVKFATPLSSEPQLRILHGKSQQILDESLVVTYKSEDHDNGYILQFLPRVSGKHFVEVRLAGVVVAKKNFTVSGKPRYGNIVQCGPDWHSLQIISTHGTVTKIGSWGSITVVTVTWEDDNKTQCEYMWGKNGEFEIEILPKI